jgi:hypothetical protein
MRLEWERTLQSYGLALREQYSTGTSNHEQGLKNLHDAIQVFRECHATFDLHRVERIPTRYTVSVIPSA